MFYHMFISDIEAIECCLLYPSWSGALLFT